MRSKISGNALVFTYRTLSQFFHEVSERTFDGKVTYCSAWPGAEPNFLQSDFYRHLRQAVPAAGLTEDDYEQIIRRCSVLKLLPWMQARQMVTAMYHVIDELVDRAAPQYLFTVMVDNYMTDLLSRVCRARGAQVVQLMAGCVKNTISVTSYGEYRHVRDPENSEVERALSSFLDDGQRVTYGSSSLPSYSARRHLIASARWWAKAMCFTTMKLLQQDSLNFLYLLGTVLGRDGRCLPWGYDDSHFEADWQDKVAKTSMKKPPLLVLLGVTPEATVGYWLRDLRYGEYEAFVLEAAQALGEHYHVLIKEHPDALGLRHRTFYQRLKSIRNVTLVPPQAPARMAIRSVDRVLLGAGTAGIEAALRGKRVATLDRPYYFLEGSYVNLGSVDAVQRLPEILEPFQPAPVTRVRQQLIVRRVLETTLQGHFLPGALLNTEENFQQTSESLKQYLSCSAAGQTKIVERSAA